MGHAYREFDWYETPLYYDIVFDADTQRECDFLEAIYERYAPTARRRLLEPACGTGRLVAEMARRGYGVLGFDRSEGALAFARKRLAGLTGLEMAGIPAEADGRTRASMRADEPAQRRRARVTRADMQDFRIRQRFDMAYCLVGSFGYLHSESDARAHLERVAEVLVPGGIYVLGFHVSEYRPAECRERWVAERDGVRVVCNISTRPPDRRARRERIRARLVVEHQREIRRYETRWEFRTYSARQFRALLAQVPELVHIDTYDYDYNPEQSRDFGVERLDQVVILQRR